MLDLHRSRRLLTIIAILVASLALQFGAQVVEAITSPPTFVLKWGSLGSNAGEFDTPAGVAATLSHVYVCDVVNHRIQVFDTSGGLIGSWGSYGSGPGEFDYPTAVAVDSAGAVYVADFGNSRIQKFTATGTFVAEWGGYGIGIDGKFNEIADIEFDSSANRLLVLDNSASTGSLDNRVIQAWDTTGVLVDRWVAALPGASFGERAATGRSLAVDAAGDIYIATSSSTKVIWVFDDTGTNLGWWGIRGSGDGEFVGYPADIEVSGPGDVYVVDAAGARIQVLDVSGTFLTKWGTSGSTDGMFLDPWSVAVDSADTVYVSDLLRHDIQKFAPDNPNDPPTVTSVSANLAPVEVNTTVNASATFDDADDLDNHTAEWDWGDGNTSAGTVDQSANTVAGSHSYDTPGVYTFSVTVTDPDADDPSSDTLSTTEYVVIYDPAGGFVTGGGWIDSPAGAYVDDASLTGRANFGFVSKYKKGANVPTGNTNFQFQAGDLHFQSTSYEWLVIAGQDKAKYKGNGTINGAGDYKFMLTAIDNGNSGDEFHIKIWDDNGGGVIYDNRADSGDDDYAGTVIGGGNIKVHKK